MNALQIAWNTGHLYTDHGQRIAARLDREKSCIYMKDIDRGITLTVKCAAELIETPEDLKRATLHIYHYSIYEEGTVLRWGIDDLDLENQLYKAACCAPSLKKGAT